MNEARIKEKDANVSSNVKQCLHNDCGSVRLSDVVLYNSYTMKALKAKHVYKPYTSLPTTLFSEAPLVYEVDTISRCIKSFANRTSCGIDGLRENFLLDALYGEGLVSLEISYMQSF